MKKALEDLWYSYQMETRMEWDDEQKKIVETLIAEAPSHKKSCPPCPKQIQQ